MYLKSFHSVLNVCSVKIKYNTMLLPILIVACRLMTSGVNGVNFVASCNFNKENLTNRLVFIASESQIFTHLALGQA